MKENKNNTILIVDDNPANIGVLYDYLKRFNYKILVAQDGYGALELLDEQLPDVILLDIIMPGMNGYDLCKKLKEREDTKDIPVIFISALSETLDKIEGFNVGGVDYITKPFQSEEVQARVSAHLTIRKQKLNIAEKENQYKTLFESISDPTFIVEKESGNILDANTAFLSLYEYTSEEIANLNILDISNEPEKRQKALQDEENYIPLRYHIKKHGCVFPVEITSNGLRFNGKDVLIVTARDISLRLEAEAKLQKYTKELKEINSSKDKFFSIIAHDLKSPFTGFLGYSDFIAHNLDELTNDEIRAMGEKMYDAAKNIFNLIENLLHWSRLQIGRMEYHPKEVSVSDITDQVISLSETVANEKNISIENSIHTPGIVFADENMIHAILRNLISNALKFTPRNGRVELTSEQTDHLFYVSVRDTGVGMNSDQLQNLFKLDKQVSTEGTEKEQGTGLGLILCKEFIEKNGGKLSVQSVLNQGSSFTFSIPLHATTKYTPI